MTEITKDHLCIRPVDLKTANALIAELHRHHKPVQGHRFSIGCYLGDKLVGVAVCGRPVARMTNALEVLEVTRLCTDGTRNACSCLYSAAARAGQALGFRKIQTFVLDTEPATSLKASGWVFEARSAGGTWNRKSRDGRREDQPLQPKQRWARQLAA